MAVLDPAIEWVQATPFPGSGTFKGVDAVIEHFKSEGIWVAFPDYRLQIDEFFESGDRVTLIGEESGTSEVSGVTVRMRFVHVWRVVDGKGVEVLELAGEPHSLGSSDG
jgi:ketosteroid isomerase-like protein